MVDFIEQYRRPIEALCRKYRVSRLEVFGSGADGSFDAARSDVDFPVEFQRADEIDTADQYFGLLEELDGTLGRRVVLVCVQAMRNPFFIQPVNRARRLLYAA